MQIIRGLYKTYTDFLAVWYLISNTSDNYYRHLHNWSLDTKSIRYSYTIETNNNNYHDRGSKIPINASVISLCKY